MLVWQVVLQVGPAPPQPGIGLWLLLAFWLLLAALGTLYSAFWLWMMIDCILREPDRFFWIWLLVIAPFPGAIVYAVARFFPQRDFTAPPWMRAWTHGKELARLETAAHQIGNAHQFIQWGDALREVSRWDQAKTAYEQAIQKDPNSLPALWGAAQVAVHQKRHAEVKELCGRILAVDPKYKFGDVSLAYGRALQDLGDPSGARQHFEEHVKRWRHPEAVYLLACECRDAGDIDAAREHLKSMLRDIHGSPAAIGRKFGRWKSRGQKLLRQLK